jgi:hypothetical protein
MTWRRQSEGKFQSKLCSIAAASIACAKLGNKDDQVTGLALSCAPESRSEVWIREVSQWCQ